jgi:hypothetical protein
VSLKSRASALSRAPAGERRFIRQCVPEGGCHPPVRAGILGSIVASALTIAFFLARPIYSFAMAKPDDAVAFVALLWCGLIAASFGEYHERNVLDFVPERRQANGPGVTMAFTLPGDSSGG